LEIIQLSPNYNFSIVTYRFIACRGIYNIHDIIHNNWGRHVILLVLSIFVKGNNNECE
jgi:hypothetical protein